jgi:fatty acid desaturase
MEPEQVNRRRVVLHPRTALARRQDRSRAFGSHVRGYTVDTEEVLALMRQQRQVSVRYLLIIVAPLVAFAFALFLWPSLRTWRPLGLLPLPWLLLGPVVLFSIVALAFFHERQALNIEQRWSDDHAANRSGPVRGSRRE